MEKKREQTGADGNLRPKLGRGGVSLPTAIFVCFLGAALITAVTVLIIRTANRAPAAVVLEREGASESAGPPESSKAPPTNDARPIIVLDPGHGGNDEGAIYGGRLEKDINLAIALIARDLLEESGIHVVMTRETDEYIGNYDRAELANQYAGAAFLSIHQNSFGADASVRGFQVCYNSSESGAQELAIVMERRLSSLGLRDRGIFDDPELVVTREVDFPSILIETGFISNAEERALLISEEFQRAIAECIRDGALEWVNAVGGASK